MLREGVLEPTRKVFAALARIGGREPENLEQWIAEQRRVILRVTPTRVSGVIRRR
ncbi:MAG: hypothetical protein ACM3S1_01375 [Hyphomicrobiales bacterium]